jgi:hypothetical protein
MKSPWLVAVAAIAAVTAYAIVDRRCRHDELVARTIAFGARLRASGTLVGVPTDVGIDDHEVGTAR